MQQFSRLFHLIIFRPWIKKNVISCVVCQRVHSSNTNLGHINLMHSFDFIAVDAFCPLPAPCSDTKCIVDA